MRYVSKEVDETVLETQEVTVIEAQKVGIEGPNESFYDEPNRSSRMARKRFRQHQLQNTYIKICVRIQEENKKISAGTPRYGIVSIHTDTHDGGQIPCIWRRRLV